MMQKIHLSQWFPYLRLLPILHPHPLISAFALLAAHPIVRTYAAQTCVLTCSVLHVTHMVIHVVDAVQVIVRVTRPTIALLLIYCYP